MSDTPTNHLREKDRIDILFKKLDYKTKIISIMLTAFFGISTGVFSYFQYKNTRDGNCSSNKKFFLERSIDKIENTKKAFKKDDWHAIVASDLEGCPNSETTIKYIVGLFGFDESKSTESKSTDSKSCLPELIEKETVKEQGRNGWVALGFVNGDANFKSGCLTATANFRENMIITATTDVFTRKNAADWTGTTGTITKGTRLKLAKTLELKAGSLKQIWGFVEELNSNPNR